MHLQYKNHSRPMSHGVMLPPKKADSPNLNRKWKSAASATAKKHTAAIQNCW